ncbi:polysaccharide deacetylase family protein [Piscibacillus salipiscarius]|uniref:polysaccharide deacetylase family protein n=1 Tax=Piscibacillus salipiscarius TaxID=299480 RepID=UPI002437102A|nr:polysaccharide deacetylase family protein [Piscibacillus salipiscarius]
MAGYGINELSKSRTFQLIGDPVTQIETEDKVVALTFDDGPGPNADEILSILDEHNVKGTFYLVGEAIEQNKEAARNIVDAGHEIGNHSYTHKRMIFKSYSFVEEEIEKTDGLIREIGYEEEITFRPPYGRKLVTLPLYLSNHDRQAIMWNLEPDFMPDISDDPEAIANYVSENIEPGSIVLLHVMYEHRDASLNSVDGMITQLKKKGYKFVTVSELKEKRDRRK